MFRDVCELAVVADGLRFDASTLVGRRIKEDADYQGVRLTFVAFLEKARVAMQIDIGFGDVVNPGAEERAYPTLLDFPAPHLRMYPRETVIAEKFEAMVNLGTLNTRMKGFSTYGCSRASTILQVKCSPWRSRRPSRTEAPD